MEEEARGMAGLSLRLGLGGEGGGGGIIGVERERKPSVQFHVLFPTGQQDEEEEEEGSFKGGGAGASSSNSSLRFTGGRRGGGRRRRRRRQEEEEEEEDARDQSSSSARKKLRLSKEQSTLLEDHFRRNTTLNLNQKMELARRLNLQPRQIEVWFQNRRARTKLKQTEVDCGFLRKYCDKISDENRRLKVELMELRSKINSSSALCATASPSASLYMKNLAYMCCPSCKKPPVLDPSAALAPPCGETKTVNFMAAMAKSGSCESETSFDIPSSSGATTTTIVNLLPWAWSSVDED